MHFDNTDETNFGPSVEVSVRPARAVFFFGKWLFDKIMSIALIPLLALFAFGLLILNPFFNKGPLFFAQKRMGKHCQPFIALKFRTMTENAAVKRDANDPLELDRITPMGRFLRKSRIDELPQILNVLKGEMSLIGPRPDYFDHAVQYLNTIKGYRERHAVLPGISGLAQTEVGYVEGTEATRKKVSADLYYISNIGFKLDTWILWRTFAVILGRSGL